MIQTKDSGIDIDLGDACSEVAYHWAKKTFKNRENSYGSLCERMAVPYAQIIHFASQKLAITSDGIGTKIEVAERTGLYHTLGYDLVAMIVDDLVCCGAIPTNLTNILDVDYLDKEIVDLLMQGLANAAFEAKIAIAGGEIAELGSRIGGFGKRMHFNWCATGLGILFKDLIDGNKITEGNEILSLRSPNLRSNGFSFARSILSTSYGKDWHEKLAFDNKTWGEILLEPSLIYSPLIVKLLTKEMKLNGIVHITGGGIPGNLRRVLETNRLGAELGNLYDPPPFMRELQRLGSVDDFMAYRLWNMGNGMLLIVEKEDSKQIISQAQEMGYQAKVSGIVKNECLINLYGHLEYQANFQNKDRVLKLNGVSK